MRQWRATDKNMFGSHDIKTPCMDFVFNSYFQIVLRRWGLETAGSCPDVRGVPPRGRRINATSDNFLYQSFGPLPLKNFAYDLSLHAPQAHVVQYADDTPIFASDKKTPYHSSLLTR